MRRRSDEQQSIKLTTKEDIALLVEEACEMFEETGCVPDALFSWKVIAAQKERGRGLGSAPHSGNPGVLGHRSMTTALLRLRVGCFDRRVELNSIATLLPGTVA
jgi:hypothetical protein